jgi:hypothetical protein
MTNLAYCQHVGASAYGRPGCLQVRAFALIPYGDRLRRPSASLALPPSRRQSSQTKRDATLC